MKIELIDTGFFYADGGAMFGAIPKQAWRRRYPEKGDNCCVLVARSALVTTDCGRIILIDTGAGHRHARLLESYRFFNQLDLSDALQERGISCEEVTDVVLTHLHFDHCGYATVSGKDKQLQPAFPNALHWVSQRQWDNFLHPHPLEKDSYFQEDMQTIAEKGLLCLLQQDTRLCPTVTLRLFDGHTPGQIVPYFTFPLQTVVFAGDVIPLTAHLSPEWISAYDTSPLLSYNEKIRLLEEVVAENMLLIYCHDAYTPYSEVKKTGTFFKKKMPGNDLSAFGFTRT